MPRKRAVRRTRRDVEKDRRREKRYERRKERRERIHDANRRNRISRILHRIHESKKHINLRRALSHTVYVRAKRAIKYRLFRSAMRLRKLPDRITVEDKIYARESLWKQFLKELAQQLFHYIIHYGFLLLAGDRVKYWSEYFRWLRTMYGVMLGRYRVPVMTIWKNGLVELHFDEMLSRLLLAPETRPATFDALAYIANELLLGNYEFKISPEEYERLKAMIQLLHQLYFTKTRNMPCKRSTYAVKLTPVTLHFFRGQTVRMYVLRYVRVRDIKARRLMIEKPLDVHFNFFKMFKSPFDLISILTYAGDTSNLTGDEQIAIRRDYHRDVREQLRTIVAYYSVSRVRRALAREFGKPEIEDGVGHCSIYLAYPRTRKYNIKKQFKIEREMFRRYRNLALG